MLEIKNLSVDYGGVHALRDVSVKVPDKGVVSIIGANGAGKSTLLKTIVGLTRQSKGTVTLDGQDISGLKPHERLDRGIVLCPEGRKLFPDLTVNENIRVGAYRMRDKKEFRERLEFLHGIFPRVAERGNQIASSLSGGEQQMLAIGRALVTNPRLLILDEATEGLAPLIREEIWACLAQLRSAGQTILVIDKYVEKLIALADSHTLIERGQVVWQGNSTALAADHGLWQRYLGV